jgi:DNA-binding MarR family transcriptional regulator
MNPLKINSIAQSIVQIACRLENHVNSLILSPLKLTLSSFKILHIIAISGSSTPSEIMAILGGSKSNITQRLNFLEKNGYIIRFLPPGKRDKRNISVKLTKKGRAKHEESAILLQKESLDLEKYFTKEEKKDIQSLFKKLNQLLDEHEKCCQKSNN